MDKNIFNIRTLIAVALLIVVFMTWQKYMTKRQSDYLKYQKQQALIKKQAQPAATPSTLSNNTAPEKGAASVSTPEAQALRSNLSEKEYSFQHPLFEVTFSSINASIKRFTLKSYKLENNNIDIIYQTEPEYYSFQTLHENNENRKFDLVRQTATQVEFSDGTFSKTYTFFPDKYYFKVSFTSKDGFHPQIRMASRYKKVETSFLKPQSQSEIPIVIYKNLSKVNVLPYENVSKDAPQDEKNQNVINWISLGTHYFGQALILPFGQNGRVHIEKQGEEIVKVWTEVANTKNIEFFAYVGPKQVNLLEEVNTLAGGNLGFEKNLDYGMFSIIAIPLLYVLKFFFSIFPNWGLAIILLTILIKLLLYPLTYKSLKAMKDLQRIQPQMAAIREKYKDDKEKLNREIMDLMKTNKVNPMGSCFPMLLQMPVFFALYQLFAVSVELYKAPFIFWIHDLSSMDPFWVLPILMGIGTFVQQKMTPNTMDPVQAKMMLMMPIVFSVIMISLPAGLNLYMLVNTIVSLIQQIIIQKYMGQNENSAPKRQSKEKAAIV